MANIIEIKGLTKKYGQLTALNNLDLEVEQGAVIGFLGPNGAGKTTTMRILTTLLFAMKDHKAKQGLATLCIGGGEAVAVVIENM